MRNAWVIVVVVFLLIVAGAIVLVVVPAHTALPLPSSPPKSFSECIMYFTPSTDSPRTCTTNLGQVFTENIGNAIAMQDLIQINNPQPNTKITSPLIITGRARGTYFFEGSFPVELVSQSGTVIAHGHADAQQPWTTNDFIQFKTSISFDRPSFGSGGTLILRNDNPSGDPARELELDVPVTF